MPETELEQLRRDVTALKARLDGHPPTPPVSADEQTIDHKLERLNYYRREDAQEWTLLTNRVNAYITSQSFLVSAYAVSMANPDLRFRVCFPMVLSTIGIIASLRAYPGIDGACKVIQLWHEKKEQLLQDPLLSDFCDGRARYLAHRTLFHRLASHLTARSKVGKAARFGKPSVAACESDPAPGDGERVDEIHITSLYFSQIAPKLFGTAWVVLVLLSLFLHFVH